MMRTVLFKGIYDLIIKTVFRSPPKVIVLLF